MLSINKLFGLMACTIFLVVTTIHPSQAADTVSLFPLDRYDQQLHHWIKPSDADYDKLLLSRDAQAVRLANFYSHLFSSEQDAKSPWNPNYINQILHHRAPDDLATLELELVKTFSNQNKSTLEVGYGENFRPYPQDWIDRIEKNMNISQLNAVLNFKSSQRGIAIDNLHARVIPTDDVHFYDYKIAGQGYPFDNLDMSSLWAGTPVYILGESQDHAWLLVVTPDYIAWVKSGGIAKTSNAFVATWQAAAKDHLVAITHSETSIIDTDGQFQFSAYVGSVFPGKNTTSGIQILIPRMNKNHLASISHAHISTEQAAIMPLSVTPHHIAQTLETLLGRPYGWGNSYFYNDCSSELKSLYTPFAIWLPRHSSNQVYAGKLVDMSAFNMDQRLLYLQQNGHKLMTIIYLGGHVVLYLGNYLDPHHMDTTIPMTYQNMWGLSPNTADRRAIVGKSVLFPLLKSFPEDPSLMSQANKKYFQIAYLDESPESLKKFIEFNLRELIYP